MAAHGLALAGITVPALRWPSLGALVAFQAAFTTELLRPGGRAFGPNVTRAGARDGSIALTFDDGPREGETERLLDKLAAAGVKAAFFFVGRRARSLPAAVRRAHEEGHTLGNHSYSHPKHWSVLGSRRVRGEIAETQDVLAGITGRAPRLFRPPMGHKNVHLQEALEEHGLRQVTWSLRSYDTLIRDARRVCARVSRKVRSGEIVLLHEGLAGRSRDGALSLEVIDALVEDLAGRGLRPVSLRTLLPDSEAPTP